MDYEDLTPDEVKKQMTEEEWQKVYEMSQDKNLYHNLCQSLFPTIYGEFVQLFYLYNNNIYSTHNNTVYTMNKTCIKWYH